MGLSFFETMRGDLRDGWGRTCPMDFEVRIAADPIGPLLATGEARLSGVAHAPPFADRAALDGTFTLLPFTAGTMIYKFHFNDIDGRRLDFIGRKSLRLSSLRKTMTTMAGELRRGDELLASGVLRFDMHDGVALLASMWPANGFGRKNLLSPVAGLPGPALLDAKEQALVLSLARAAITTGLRVPAADDETVARTLDHVAALAPPAPALWRAALKAFDAAVLLRCGCRFQRMALPDRQALLKSWKGSDADGRRKPLRRMIDFVLKPILAAHFSRPDYLGAIGFPDLNQQVREAPQRWMRQVTPAEQLDAETTIEAQVVVVGTGAGGAAMAARLAEFGLAVAVVEEGSWQSRAAFSGDPMDRMRALYRDNGMTFTAGRPPISVPMGRMVGGTTAINSGTCLRTPDSVLDQWRNDLGLPDDFSAAAFGRHLDQVEAELRVTPNAPRYLGRIAEMVATGADAMAMPHAPLPRNAPDCDGQGTCILGCPTDAKRSTNVSWMPRALRAGAQVFTGLPVTRLLMRGRRCVGIEARGADSFGAARILRVRADAVVLACGSLLTPSLLLDNGFRLPWLGRNLSLHPGMGMYGLTDAVIKPWNAVPQGYSAYAPALSDVVFEGVYMPPHFAIANFPLLGAELSRWMDRHDRTVQFGFMVRDAGVGRVMRPVGGVPVIRYDLSETSRAKLQQAAAVLAELLLRGGATEVMTGFAGRPVIHDIAQARDLANHRIPAWDFNLLGAHPLGTCRVGRSAEHGVIDFDHKVFGTDNLYVADGGAVPTSLGVNPQLTIMAMALRAGERLAARLD